MNLSRTGIPCVNSTNFFGIIRYQNLSWVKYVPLLGKLKTDEPRCSDFDYFDLVKNYGIIFCFVSESLHIFLIQKRALRILANLQCKESD